MHAIRLVPAETTTLLGRHVQAGDMYTVAGALPAGRSDQRTRWVQTPTRLPGGARPVRRPDHLQRPRRQRRARASRRHLTMPDGGPATTKRYCPAPTRNVTWPSSERIVVTPRDTLEGVPTLGDLRKLRVREGALGSGIGWDAEGQDPARTTRAPGDRELARRRREGSRGMADAPARGCHRDQGERTVRRRCRGDHAEHRLLDGDECRGSPPVRHAVADRGRSGSRSPR